MHEGHGSLARGCHWQRHSSLEAGRLAGHGWCSTEGPHEQCVVKSSRQFTRPRVGSPQLAPRSRKGGRTKWWDVVGTLAAPTLQPSQLRGEVAKDRGRTERRAGEAARAKRAAGPEAEGAPRQPGDGNLCLDGHCCTAYATLTLFLAFIMLGSDQRADETPSTIKHVTSIAQETRGYDSPGVKNMPTSSVLVASMLKTNPPNQGKPGKSNTINKHHKCLI